MQQIETHCSFIDKALTTTPTGDLREVANAATAAAEIVRLGYGRLEDKRAPGFAGHARDAESWFLQIALEARQAHGAIARDLFVGGRTTHCACCHDACKRLPLDRVARKKVAQEERRERIVAPEGVPGRRAHG
ncbi:MAG: hypothetical protein ABIP94_06970 [Planctomycetota bacterium]